MAEIRVAETTECSLLNQSILHPNTMSVMPDPEISALLVELRAYCKEKRGRLRHLAVELGVSDSLLANWFSGHRTPKITKWLKLEAVAKRIREGK
jgi:hypothetical protein